MNRNPLPDTRFQIASLLLLGLGDGAVERAVFRRLGVSRVQRLHSGRDALALLAASSGTTGSQGALRPGLIVCEERLEDMNGIEFLCQLRSLPDLAGMPVVFLSGSDGPLTRGAENSGSCAVLRRPYTRDDVNRAFAAAFAPACLRAPLPLPEMLIPREGLMPKPARPVQPDQSLQPGRPVHTGAPHERDLFQAGFAALREGDVERARALLTRCHAWDATHAEACLALARLFAGENNQEEAVSWLARAGIALYRRGDSRKASEVLSRLPGGERGVNTLLTEIARILRDEEYLVAARLFIEARRITPQTPLHSMVGRCCLFTPAPQKTLHGICAALERLGHDSTAARLRLRLEAPDYETPPRRENFLERFPLLYDIVSVASFTYGAWKRAV